MITINMKIFQQRVLPIILLTICSQMLFAQKTNKTNENEDVRVRLEKKGLGVDQKFDTLYEWYRSLDKVSKIQKVDLDNAVKNNEVKIKELNSKITTLTNELNKKLPLSDLEYRSVGKLKWAAKNIDSDQIVTLINDIKYVNTNDTRLWNRSFEDSIPAFCYHANDTTKQYGVLLNKWALLRLNAALSATSWRLPTPEDFDYTSNFIGRLKPATLLALLTSGKDAPAPNWKNPGLDLFDLNIAPLSYRRNTTKQWFGGDAASFFCYDNKGDKELNSTLLIAEINELDKNIIVIEKDLKDEFNNFGVFVRLIHK